MIFFETEVFTQSIAALLSDEDYRHLQQELLCDPKAGAVIPGCGGIRKLRWRRQGSGKRGGIRVIYYYIAADGCIFMLLAYSKRQVDDLTSQQKKILANLVKEELS